MVILGSGFAIKYAGRLELKLSNISGLPTGLFLPWQLPLELSSLSLISTISSFLFN